MPEAGWVNKSRIAALGKIVIQPLARPVVLGVFTEFLHHLFLGVVELGRGDVVRFSRWAGKILVSTTIVVC